MQKIIIPGQGRMVSVSGSLMPRSFFQAHLLGISFLVFKGARPDLNIAPFSKCICLILVNDAAIYPVSQTRNPDIMLESSNSFILCIKKWPSFPSFTNYFSNSAIFHLTNWYHFSTGHCNFQYRLLYLLPYVFSPLVKTPHYPKYPLNKLSCDSLSSSKPLKGSQLLLPQGNSLPFASG